MKPQLKLYFTSEPLQLDKTVFTHPGLGGERVAVRGKTEGAYPDDYGSFEWRAGVKALSVLFLRSAAWAYGGETGPPPVLAGRKGSAATSLDYLINTRKPPNWLKDMFGTDAGAVPFIADLIGTTNPGGKRKSAPVELSLRTEVFPPDNIVVYVDGRPAEDADEIEVMANQIEVSEPGWQTTSRPHIQRERTEGVGVAVTNIQAPAGRPVTGSYTAGRGILPSPPELVVGRDEVLAHLKRRLGVVPEAGSGAAHQSLTVVRGWPGVGKSTVVAALAHETDVANAYSDGILWTSLGQKPELLSELANWGRALEIEGIGRAKTVRESSSRLAEGLRLRRMLLIVDDVWEAEHGAAFRIGGADCATLMTTRLPGVANALAPTPEAVYVLPVLDEHKSLELLSLLAPTVVSEHAEESRELVDELEGLPLALRVAGRLLNAEHSMGWGVEALLQELRQEVNILEAEAPADCADLISQTTPTVAALLRKSTDHLEEHVRDCFAMLGPFAPKPATFDLDAISAVWEIDDPRPVVRQLVGRGLLEPVGSATFQLHGLLVTHAKSLMRK